VTAPIAQPGLRALLDRRERTVDVAFAGLLLVLCLLAGVRGHGWAAYALTGALVAPLALRRRWPTAVFGAIAAAALVQFAAGLRLGADVALLIALYSVAAHATRARLLACFAVLQAGIVLVAVRWSVYEARLYVLGLLTSIAVAGAVLGANARTRRQYVRSIVDRAERLERERDQQGQLAAAAERTRIARELHDIVAHNLTVMTALADGAGFAARSDPARAAETMATVSSTGRQALAEMRRLLGVLRDGDGGAVLAPQPGLAQLDELLEQVRGAGLPVALRVEGTPRALGAGVELTVYRLVQEALTNTLKHAGAGVSAALRLRYEAGAIDVELTDDGAPAALAATATPAGAGLAGMRERVAVFGGAVDAGPLDAGGWRVHARLAVPAR